MRLAKTPGMNKPAESPPCFWALASATTYEARKDCYKYTGYEFQNGPHSEPQLLIEAALPLAAVFRRELSK